MVGKKGEIEIQFNWILILIAGALIFLFFFSIINWVRDSSDKGISLTIARNLDAILTGASIPRDTVDIIDSIPFEKIEFSCDGYIVDKSVNSRPISNKIIFSPTRLEKGVLVTWSFSWSVPFRIVNFLHLSSPKIRYIFITGDVTNDLFRYLNETFPKELSPEFYSPANSPPPSFDDYNNYKVRIVYIDTTYDSNHILNFRGLDAEDVTALHIQSGSGLGGDVTFYKKTSPAVSSPSFNCYLTSDCPGSSSKYFAYASLLGAIFSESPEDYECNMEKAFLRMNSIASIYRRRAEALKQYYSLSGGEPNFSCEQTYSFAISILQNLETLDFSSGIGGMDALYSQLESENENAQSRSCALIY